ncbi:acyltransferase family protein [Herbiconiux sp. P17]|uniref:acyltransferase family protein n=1 Tax=Herbiconiux wuyangfengii TaxID=3342794 RepID=UPI0035BB7E88
MNRKIGNATSKRSLRPDIQGLRMIAVVAVIFDHLLAWPSGGFVGVDVFFVISGFLITGILIREHEKTNHISFVGFYKRRIKRIVPAATAVLIATVAAAFVIFTNSRYIQTFWDAVYAFFFSANWHFAAVGTDYFQQAGPVSPLQHFWSLSVEEQFYFVWPWLMLGILALAGLRTGFRRRRTVLGIVMTVIIVVTFVWAMYESTSNPTVAYFSTFTRAWELGVGALLAITTPWWGRINLVWRTVLGWIGLVGIVASYFVINDGLPFPAPWAALPVLATAVVIIAGVGGEQRYLWPLTNPVSFYIGNISYSLYLWHFPIIIFAAILLGSNPWVVYPVTIAAIIVFSVASYHLIEEPIQHSPWLTPKPKSRRAQNRWGEWRAQYGKRMKFGWLGILGAVCAGLVVTGLTINYSVPPSSQALSFAPATTSATDPADVPVTAASTEHDAINAALTVTEFPALQPSVDQLGIGGWSDTLRATGCLDVVPENVDSCVFGPADADKDVVVFGDSYGMSWMPGIRNALESSGWRIHQITRGQCPSIEVDVVKDTDTPYPECIEWRAWALQTIAAIQPDLTILASGDSTGQRLVSKATGTEMRNQIAAGTTAMLNQVVPLSGQTVIMGAPPRGAILQECFKVGAVPKDCTTRPADLWSDFTGGQEAAAGPASVPYIQTRDWVCGDSGWCPPFVGTTPLRVDNAHLTIEFSTMLGPVIAEALAAQTQSPSTNPSAEPAA